MSKLLNLNKTAEPVIVKKKSIWKKILIFSIILIVGIVILAFVGNSMRPATSVIYPISGFTYESNQGGFSLKYPVELEKRENSGMVGFAFPVKPGEESGKVFKPTLVIMEASVEAAADLKTFNNQVLATLASSSDVANINIIESENSEFNGIKSIKTLMSYDYTKTGEEIPKIMAETTTFKKGSMYYFMVISYTGETKQDSYSTFEKIVESINFDYTLPKEVDYYIYKNREYSFSLRIPQWVQFAANPELGFVSRFFNPDDKSGNKVNQENISIFVENIDSSAIDLYTLDRLYQLSLKHEDYNLISNTDIILNSGDKAKKLIYSYNQGDGNIIKEIEVLFIKNSKIYSIDYFPVNEANLVIFDEVVKSFQVTN